MPGTRSLRLPAALAMALLIAGVAPPPAAADGDQDKARDAVKAGKARPLKELLPRVRNRVDGRILDAEIDDRGGPVVYRLKMLDRDGHVFDLYVDGRTGEVLDIHGRD